MHISTQWLQNWNANKCSFATEFQYRAEHLIFCSLFADIDMLQLCSKLS